MRWKLAILLRLASGMLLASLPCFVDDARSNELGGGLGTEAVANDYCQGDCGLVCGCEPQTFYSASANLLWLGRNKVDPNFLIATPANAPAFSLLHTSELEFNVEAGVELGLRARRRNGQTWELRYFGIFDQLANERRTYNDGDADNTNDATILHFDEDIGSYTDLTTAYSSDLHSGELNLWLNERWGIEPVVGLRWFRQNEDLETFVSTDLTEASLVEFANNLYGAQIGLRAILWEAQSGWSCRYRVETTLKGGVFHNDMQLDSEYRRLGAVTPTFDRSFNSLAYGGELSLTAVLQFCPYFSVNIGYTGLWLDRVGLAADQMDNFSSTFGTGDVDLTTLIYQGGHLGFEFAW